MYLIPKVKALPKWFSFCTILLSFLIYSQASFAQPSFQIGSGVGGPGDTVMVPVNFTDLAPADTAAFDLMLSFDAATVSAVDLTACNGGAINGAPVLCSNPSPGQINIIITTFPPVPIDTGLVGTIGFTIDAAAPIGITPLGIIDENFFDALGISIEPAPSDSTEGTLTVQAVAGQGFYGSLPVAGGNLDLGTAVVNSAAVAVDNLNIANLSPDTDFAVSAIGTTVNVGTAAVTSAPATPFTVGFNANTDADFVCTPGSRGAITGDIAVTHDSVGGAPSPVAYTFNCAGLSPNVVVAPTTVTLAGVIGLADPTGMFNVSNAQDGFTSDALNASLVESGTAEISITDGLTDATISVDETDAVTVSCSTATAGMFTETITVAWDDPITGGQVTQDVTVNCDIINEIPEYVSVPVEGTTLGFGAVLNGSVSAPLGIDIGNTDTDVVPNGILSITAAAIAGPDAAVFALTTDPTGLMVNANVGPDGTPDAQVTCTPTDGFSAFTATLTITSNDPDSPHAYPLTCMGDSDAAFDSNPQPGIVNAGILLPGTNVDTIIELINTGTTDPLTATSCALIGDAEFTLVSPTFPIDIPAGGSVDVVVNCAIPSPGLFEASLSCDIQDVAGATVASPVFDLRCVGAAVDVPTLSQAGLLALIMTLMLGGFLAFRLRQN